MVDVQTVSIVVASASVVAGIIYYAFQVRHQSKVRQTDLILRLVTFYNSKDFQEELARVRTLNFIDVNDYLRKYGPLVSSFPNEVQFSLLRVGSFSESLGVLVKEKLLDINLVAELFMVDMYWKKTEPLVKELRKQVGNPALYEWSEYLYNELQKRKQKTKVSST